MLPSPISRNLRRHDSRLSRFSAVSAIAMAAALATPAAAQQPPAPEQNANRSAAAGSVLLDTISVTANMTPTELSRVGSAVTIITSEQIQRRQIRFVADALRQVPGVAVTRSGPMGKQTEVRIRGSEANQTKVIIDGVVVNDPATGSEFDFANLLTDDVARIEVLRGPQSALYGSDAIGGVINIITRKGAGKPRFSARIEGGSHQTLNGSAAYSYGDERFNFIIGANGFTTDGVSAADRRYGNFENDGYRNRGSYAKFGFNPNEFLEFNVMGRYSKFYNKTDGYAGGVGAYDTNEDNQGDQVLGRAEAKLKLLDGRWNHTISADRSDQSNEYRADRIANAHSRGAVSRYEYKTDLRFDTPSFLDASHIVTFAAQHKDERFRTKSAWSTLDQTMTSTGLAGEYQGTFRNLTLTASVRHDNNDVFKDSTTYRFTGAYRIEQTGTRLRASYGTGVKNPTMLELYGYTSTYRGNPDLKAEKARGWDLGVDQEIWGDRLVLNATYFNQRISDLITGAGITSINMPGTSTVQGAELGLTVQPVDGLTISGSYTYTDGKDSAGAELIRRPRNMASLNVNYGFLEGKANVNLGVIYKSAQKDWAYDAFYNQGVVTLGAHALVNIGGSYRINDNAELFAKIDNLFDKRYQEVYTYGAVGRSATLGARITF